jgi:hypothetical protein
MEITALDYLDLGLDRAGAGGGVVTDVDRQMREQTVRKWERIGSRVFFPWLAFSDFLAPEPNIGLAFWPTKHGMHQFIRRG